MEILFLDKDVVRELLSMETALQAVEGAFRQKGMNKVVMPPKVYVQFEKFNGDFRAMPAYLPESDVAGVKIVNVHPRNPERFNLPSVMACILFLEPRTGAPLCMLEGSLLTALRTGAAGGVAVKYLARKDSKRVGIVGAGVQAKTQLLAVDKVLRNKLNEVIVFDKNGMASERLAKEMREKIGATITPCLSIEEVSRRVDVLVTVTPSTSPIVRSEWMEDGTHVNAIGADAPGKEELDPAILKRAKIIVDDFEQATHSGEVNVPLAKGIINIDDIYAEIGEIVAGKKLGRETKYEITVFDSTGLAIQDVSVASRVYEQARTQGMGEWLHLS